MAISGRLDQWMRGGANLSLHGRRIFVRTAVTHGRPALLLIHGYPTASYDALDRLGFGSSEKPLDSGYPIALQADLCQAVLDHFGVNAAHVLAHDYGDTVAQELLAREREGRIRLASVCFLNGGLFPETHRARPVQKALALPLIGPLLARAMTYERFAATMRSIGGRTPPAPDELADLWVLIQRENGRQALGRLINYMEQRRRHRDRWVGALVGSTVPRRLICGAMDPVSGAHLAERYRQLVPGADTVLLDEAGHYPHLEDPEGVLEAYLCFRDRIDLARR
jgi:pimeloyl-ACP methyl ester carboxylesterase